MRDLSSRLCVGNGLFRAAGFFDRVYFLGRDARSALLVLFWDWYALVRASEASFRMLGRLLCRAVHNSLWVCLVRIVT